jgi:hypothetical protein
VSEILTFIRWLSVAEALLHLDEHLFHIEGGAVLGVNSGGRTVEILCRRDEDFTGRAGLC